MDSNYTILKQNSKCRPTKNSPYCNFLRTFTRSPSVKTNVWIISDVNASKNMLCLSSSCQSLITCRDKYPESILRVSIQVAIWNQSVHFRKVSHEYCVLWKQNLWKMLLLETKSRVGSWEKKRFIKIQLFMGNSRFPSEIRSLFMFLLLNKRLLE